MKFVIIRKIFDSYAKNFIAITCVSTLLIASLLIPEYLLNYIRPYVTPFSLVKYMEPFLLTDILEKTRFFTPPEFLVVALILLLPTLLIAIAVTAIVMIVKENVSLELLLSKKIEVLKANTIKVFLVFLVGDVLVLGTPALVSFVYPVTLERIVAGGMVYELIFTDIAKIIMLGITTFAAHAIVLEKVGVKKSFVKSLETIAKKIHFIIPMLIVYYVLTFLNSRIFEDITADLFTQSNYLFLAIDLLLIFPLMEVIKTHIYLEKKALF